MLGGSRDVVVGGKVDAGEVDVGSGSDVGVCIEIGGMLCDDDAGESDVVEIQSRCGCM